jgi:UDP-N-acetylmuramoyl-tripeptide--D-alanyl-D-alanine ligase
MERLSLRELVDATGGHLRDVDASNVQFDRITIDSRTSMRGDVFWALQGERHDGHDFVVQAQAQGATLSVVSSHRAASVPGPKLVVNETLVALGRFASWYRSQIDSLVIGVTGSVGKTTTREMIHAALSSQFKGIRSDRNFNNRIGLPLSLFSVETQHEFAVLEMGASEVGEIQTLCQIAQPEIGVVTAIGPAHLQTFGSLAAIIQTKGDLLEALPSCGFAVLPGDDPALRQMADRAPCPVIFVGQGDDNQIRATRVEVNAGHLRFRCEGNDFDIPVTGRHALTSALCAIAIGLEIGIQPRSLAGGLANFKPAAGRCELIRIGPWTVIDDTYNASPLSVAAACQLLRELVLPGLGQRLLVLGDMRELGETAVAEHERIGNLAGQLRFDRLLVCGEHADDVARGAEQSGMQSHQIAAAADAETLLAVLDCWLEQDDVLLVKGSRATRMERVVAWLKDRAKWDGRLRGSEQQRFCA